MKEPQSALLLYDKNLSPQCDPLLTSRISDWSILVWNVFGLNNSHSECLQITLKKIPSKINPQKVTDW